MYRAQSIQIQNDLESKINDVKDEESNIMKEIKKYLIILQKWKKVHESVIRISLEIC